MSQLIRNLTNALAGAISQELPDPEICKIILSIVDDDKREFPTTDAADYLNKSEATMKRWRSLGIGPKYRKEPGGAVRYRLDWLREFQTEGVVEG